MCLDILFCYRSVPPEARWEQNLRFPLLKPCKHGVDTSVSSRTSTSFLYFCIPFASLSSSPTPHCTCLLWLSQQRLSRQNSLRRGRYTTAFLQAAGFLLPTRRECDMPAKAQTWSPFLLEYQNLEKAGEGRVVQML